VLVGPSAGYTLPDQFLSGFSTIRVLEPDPIAGFLLGRRLRRLGVPFEIDSSDRLISPLLHGGNGLAEMLRADPAARLIFGNVLGQTRFLMPEADFAPFKRAFRERIVPLLAERAWLSFHDRLSGSLAPKLDDRYTAPARLDDQAILRELYPTMDASAHANATVELFDHQSDGFFPSQLPHTYFHWQIERTRHHLIEGVTSSPESWQL